ILDWMILPAHMIQGSRVTYKIHSLSFHVPNTSLASLIASISACASGFCLFSLKLWAFAMILFWYTTTAPTGTSSSSYAFFASLSASFIYVSCITAPPLPNKKATTHNRAFVWLLYSYPDQIRKILL